MVLGGFFDEPKRARPRFTQKEQVFAQARNAEAESEEYLVGDGWKAVEVERELEPMLSKPTATASTATARCRAGIGRRRC